jgi:hypothetical protein
MLLADSGLTWYTRVVDCDNLFKRNLSAVIKHVLWCSVIVKHLWWQCADKLHQQFQKINWRHCRVSESNWNYWPPLMVYLKVNLWTLKMYTATIFEKRATTHAWKISQGKVNIWNEMWTCEWKVSNSIGKGINKTEWKVADKMVKWSDTSENVLRQLKIIQIQRTYVISSQKNLKNGNFQSYSFKKFPA